MQRLLTTAKDRIAARYIPLNAIAETHDDLNAVIYYHTNPQGKIGALAYKGTAQKPAFNYLFRSEEHRDTYINQWLADLRDSEERKHARRDAAHTLAVGDILYCSWGYDQTNVDFYQVLRVVSTKSVEIRKLKKETKETYSMRGETQPYKDQFIEKEKPMIKRARDDYVLRINGSRGTASKWHGEPVFCSWYA